VTSFTTLKTLPVDFLKIGGPFVRGVAEDPMYGSIVNAVAQIGRSIGIPTIAKQVGSERVLEKLRTLGIEYAQGRALTPPVPLTDSGGHVTMRSMERSA
jgi:EAL domain-containing protein (putative c-di-GMP-specific phosphodiesterase class I)